MCGICGIVHFKGEKAAAASLELMKHRMKHRGPDDQGIFLNDNVGLGFVRLSILDLSPAGHQPMFSSDSRLVLIFNGEIYNYIELREELKAQGFVFKTRTDAEVLLAAYQAWGEACLNRFNGMWAFVIYDKAEKTLFIARDRFGVKPFYYHLDDQRFVFASEIPPILSILGKKPAANERSIFDYLVFNRTDQNDETFFLGIKKLQHGHCLRIDARRNGADRLRLWRWYDLRQNLKEPFRTPEEFREVFSSAVGLRLRSDVPVGVCLSGGLDSSSIVSLLLRDYQKQDLKTFSAVYGKGQPGDESEFINEYRNEPLHMHFTNPSADTLFTDMQRFIRAHGEPVPSTSPYTQFKVMELAKENVVVTLDGQGADEQLAGYHYFFGFYFKELLSGGRFFKMGSEVIQYLKLHHSLFGLKTLAYFLLPVKMRQWMRVAEKGYLIHDFVDRNRSASTVADDLYGSRNLKESLLDHFEFKLEHLFKWEDRNSMIFSLEARLPFLDYRLVERTLSLPGEMIIKNGMTKYILREAMRGVLPENIRLRRDKIGFSTPQAEWFRSEHFQAFIRALLASDLRLRGIIDAGKAWEMNLRHLKRKGDYSKEIWKWINLELWFREYIDN